MALVRAVRALARLQQFFPSSGTPTNQFLGSSLLCAMVTLFSLLIPAHRVATSQSLPGVLPFSTNDFGVDLATGNVNMAFPLRSKVGKIPFWSKIVGTSGFGLSGSSSVPMLLGGWTYQDPTTAHFSYTVASQTAKCPYGTGQTYYYAELLEDFAITDSTGASHRFPWAQGWIVGNGTSGSSCASQTGSLGPIATTDGSGYSLYIVNSNLTVYDKSGNSWTGTCTYSNGCRLALGFYDPDGAAISNSSSSGSTYVNDTLGTVAITDYPNVSTWPPNLGGGAPVPSLSYADVNGNSQQYGFGYTAMNIANNGCPTYAYTNWQMPTSITLPGSGAGKYVLTYEPTQGMSGYYTGRIASITLPSGGSMSYAYSGGDNGVNCNNLAVPTLTVTVNDSNGNSNTYTYVSSQNTQQINGSWSVASAGVNFTVTKTDEASGNQTMFHFNLEYQTEAQYYQGSAGGTPLKTVITCYNGNLTNCAAPSTNVALPITQTDVYTSYGSGASDLVETKYDSYGNVISEIDMDYGNVGSNGQCNSATAGVCKLTTITYGSWTGSGCTAVSNMPGLPCDVKVANNNTGTLIAETHYTYNATGHPTAVSKWVSGSTWLTTTNAYNSNGTLASTIDPNNNTTQFGYAATGSGGCNGVLPTSTTFPLVGSSSQTWNCNGGVVASSTDFNNRTTSYSYDDPLWRLTGTNYPDGGSVSISYNTESSFPWSISTTTALNASTSMTKTTEYDGLARAIQTETSDPAGADITNSSYDADGRVSTVTSPHRSSASPTDGITTYYYDALDRNIATFEPDGSKQQWCYNGITPTNLSIANCAGHLGSVTTGTWVDFTDEANNHWQRTTDSLGRLTEVMEPNGTSQTPSMETDYSYDVLNDLLSVTQNGLSGNTPRSRQFTYDGISRLIQAYNPETGWVCYGTTGGAGANVSNCTSGYDGNGNLLYKTDANGTTLTYTYDALNRLSTQSGYDAVYTRTYDQGTNGIGRLTQEYFPAAQLGTQFSYDPMGRVIGTNVSFYAAGQNGTWIPGMSVQYDLAGDITQLTYPDQRIVQQSWDGAGRLAAVWDGTGGTTGTIYLSGPQSGGVSCPSGTPASNCVAYYASGAESASAFAGGVSQNILLNNRLQPCREMVSTPLLQPVSSGGNLMDRQLFYGSTPETNCGVAAQNNGDIWHIVEGVGGTSSQNFTYDTLNRLTSAYSTNRPAATSYNYTYQNDPFGNMLTIDNMHTPMNYGIDSATNRLTLNGSLQTGNFQYYPNGQLSQSPAELGGYYYYFYTADGLLRSISTSATQNTYNPGSYVYDSLGERSLAVHNNQTWNEYVYLNGHPVADIDNTGNWTDYVYANGRKVARVASTKSVFQYKGTRTSANLPCGVSGWMNGLDSVISQLGPFQSGDVLSFDMRIPQTDTGIYAVGGIGFWANGQGYTVDDQEGQPNWDSTVTDGKWHHRTFQIGQTLAGTTLSNLEIDMQNTTPAGDWEIDYANMVFTRANGTIIPVLTNGSISETGWDGTPFSSTPVNECGSNNVTAAMATVAVDATEGATYYLADQVGTTQMELSAGGWPIWQGAFSPFGQEIVNGGEQNVPGGVLLDGTDNRYKFTGKERDTESGDDYFGARYYASSMGRMMSPDPSQLYFADPTNPQSLNLYAYVRNNPLIFTDPNGLDCTYNNDDGSQTILKGDCRSDDDDGVYTDCDGCLMDQPVHADSPQNPQADDDSTDANISPSDSTSPAGLDLPGFLLKPTGCLAANIAAVNAASNLNVSAGNVVGNPYIYNGGLDVDFSVPGGSQSSLPATRYPSSTFNAITGIGSSLHVPPFGGTDPSTYGTSKGNFTFTTHIDSAYATWHTPVGVLIHYFVDVRGHGAHRKPC